MLAPVLFLGGLIVSLSLPPDFTWIGPAACERCLQLQLVDLSRTDGTKSLSQVRTTNLVVHCSTSFCGLRATSHIPQNRKKKPRGGHMLSLFAFDKCGQLDTPSGFASFRQTPKAVATCGLMISMRKCTRTHISFAKPCQEHRLAHVLVLTKT